MHIASQFVFYCFVLPPVVNKDALSLSLSLSQMDVYSDTINRIKPDYFNFGFPKIYCVFSVLLNEIVYMYIFIILS